MPQNQQTQEEETMQQVIDRYRDMLKRRDEEISRLEDAIKTPKEPEPTPLVSGKLTWEKGKEAKDLAFFFMRRSASLTMQDAAHRDIVLDLQTKKLEWGKWEDGGE